MPESSCALVAFELFACLSWYYGIWVSMRCATKSARSASLWRFLGSRSGEAEISCLTATNVCGFMVCMTATDIGKQVGRSRVAVVNRIDALVQKGEITHFGISLRKKPCPVLFEIKFRPQGSCDVSVPKFKSKFRVNKAWSVTGASDLFIWTEADISNDIHLMRQFLTAQPEVADVTTHAVSRIFD